MLSRYHFQKCVELSNLIGWWIVPNPDTQFKNLVREIIHDSDVLEDVCEYIAGCIFEETYPNPTYESYVDIYVNRIYD